MINEANEPSSACRLWRIPQVETSTPPSGAHSIMPHGSMFKAQCFGVAEGRRRDGVVEYWSCTPTLQYSNTPHRKRGRRRADPARTTRFLSQRRLVVHVAHAVTAAVAGRSFFLLLRNLGDEAFGGEQQAGDRGRILQRGAGDLLRVHDAGFDEVLIFSRRHVVSLVALAPLDFFNDD